ncbi:MAG: hypothetical protein NTY59_09635 [Alphaproteobacteria bacterium]|nr:hypothetical protein [Alphaproteobacteria bacterium]
MRASFGVAVLFSVFLPCAAFASDAKPAFDPVGLWRFHHTDGSSFLAHLKPDQTATTDWGGGERGIWRWEGERVRIYYTDGWDDVLYARDGAYRKSGYAPDADRCGPASNDAGAEKLSGDPASKPL